MRRLPAFLMIAALVAVLVPSAALAGRPPAPNITSVSVVSDGPSSAVPANCYVRVTVDFEGRVSEVYVRQQAAGETQDDGRWVETTKKSFTITTTRFTPQLGSKDYTWTVDLLDRKRNSLLAEPVVVGPEEWDSCPGSGVLIFDPPYTAP